tara:strand:+ start:1696 stop:2292 length:597 start_codon:yes stop_codon:yes gene_type:complete
LDLDNYLPKKLVKKVYDDLSKKLDKKYHYHNLFHTKRVINSAIKIGSNYELSKNEWEILLTSCLLHDYAFIDSHIDHEEKGAILAKEILPAYSFNDSDINSIQSLILITKVDAKPQSLLESIIRDADLEYLGSSNFEKISEYLKREWIECGVVKDDVHFYDIQLKFLNIHKFYTDFMREEGKSWKEKNMKYARRVASL